MPYCPRKERDSRYPKFKGRSGDRTDKNYLADPRTVAISAASGKIIHYLDEKVSYYQLREKIGNLLSLNPI